MAMAMADLPILAALKMKMGWHHGRQRVLAENVANADTPGYRPRDLKAPDFRDMVERQGAGHLAPARTHAAHLGAGPVRPGFQTARNAGWEVTPGGNGVVLEEQMMKVADNQMDYQLATTLYGRSLGLLRSAIGRR